MLKFSPMIRMCVLNLWHFSFLSEKLHDLPSVLWCLFCYYLNNVKTAYRMKLEITKVLTVNVCLFFITWAILCLACCFFNYHLWSLLWFKLSLFWSLDWIECKKKKKKGTVTSWVWAPLFTLDSCMQWDLIYFFNTQDERKWRVSWMSNSNTVCVTNVLYMSYSWFWAPRNNKSTCGTRLMAPVAFYNYH